MYLKQFSWSTKVKHRLCLFTFPEDAFRGKSALTNKTVQEANVLA